MGEIGEYQKKRQISWNKTVNNYLRQHGRKLFENTQVSYSKTLNPNVPRETYA